MKEEEYPCEIKICCNSELDLSLSVKMYAFQCSPFSFFMGFDYSLLFPGTASHFWWQIYCREKYLLFQQQQEQEVEFY